MAGHGKAQEVRIAKMRARTPFKSGNVSAVAGATYHAGRMPTEHAREYMNAANAGEVAYTVVSYGTPIAYVLTDGKIIMPEVKYSMSTTMQQGEVRRALFHTY